MMIPKAHHWKWVCLLIGKTMLVGCAVLNTERPSNSEMEHELSADSVSGPARSQHDTVRYYISRLPDRDYVETYGDVEHPRPWYTAAEALGKMGKPAVPALIERLDTPDLYELKLVLYALMLASQDPAVQAMSSGEYLRLNTVLTQDSNQENRRRALDWWQRYRHLWP